MVAFGFCINMVPMNGWDTNNVWHVYGRGGNPHAHNDFKRIMWSMLYNTRADHIQLMIHSGCLNERLYTILIWRTATLDPWHSHGMLYLHDWWFVGFGTVHNCRDSVTESQSLYGTICCINLESIPKHYSGVSEHYLQCNLEITRDVNLFGSLSRLINVL